MWDVVNIGWGPNEESRYSSYMYKFLISKFSANNLCEIHDWLPHYFHCWNVFWHYVLWFDLCTGIPGWPYLFWLLISIHSKHRARILNGSPVYVDPSAPNLGAYIHKTKIGNKNLQTVYFHSFISSLSSPISYKGNF
jgi:hypothetical protein